MMEKIENVADQNSFRENSAFIALEQVFHSSSLATSPLLANNQPVGRPPRQKTRVLVNWCKRQWYFVKHCDRHVVCNVSHTAQ